MVFILSTHYEHEDKIDTVLDTRFHMIFLWETYLPNALLCQAVYNIKADIM